MCGRYALTILFSATGVIADDFTVPDRPEKPASTNCLGLQHSDPGYAHRNPQKRVCCREDQRHPGNIRSPQIVQARCVEGTCMDAARLAEMVFGDVGPEHAGGEMISVADQMKGFRLRP